MVKIADVGRLDQAKFVFSGLLLILSAVLTFYAMLQQVTTFWKVVPGWAAVLLLLVLLFWLGVVEGLMLSLVELKKLGTDSYKTTHPNVHAVMKTINKGDNLERFLMGRQVDADC